MSDNGRPLPKFGEWGVNDPASAEGFTVIFNKARNEKKTGGNPESPGKTATEPHSKPTLDPAKPQSKKMVLLHTKPSCRILTMLARVKQNNNVYV
uniref:RIN4 pathogenic type III effector avirulence factor Avr cleavage site domain-containing protein n=1 Tax=Medicago truncatula TaxID=3880 RepID=B7FF83_MEDTR|nr:unknown [Medicago truncatula]AFK38484.1 unknown [Medicago truncatula]